MKIDAQRGDFQERKTAKIKTPQDKTPGKISKNLKRIRSLGFFKSGALPILR